ncbi:hypothetical protein [Streptomyces sp. NPDC057257]|uniref:hypothetical protein n=1 Tax=Streptomyces sp. NPDC057257 TaxID=3346071 RepID=UPI00362B173A
MPSGDRGASASLSSTSRLNAAGWSLKLTASGPTTSRVYGELSEGAESVATRIVDGRGKVVAPLSVVVAADSIKLQAAVRSLVASGLGLSRSPGWRPGIPIRTS